MFPPLLCRGARLPRGQAGAWPGSRVRFGALPPLHSCPVPVSPQLLTLRGWPPASAGQGLLALGPSLCHPVPADLARAGRTIPSSSSPSEDDNGDLSLPGSDRRPCRCVPRTLPEDPCTVPTCPRPPVTRHGQQSKSNGLNSLSVISWFGVCFVCSVKFTKLRDGDEHSTGASLPHKFCCVSHVSSSSLPFRDSHLGTQLYGAKPRARDTCRMFTATRVERPGPRRSLAVVNTIAEGTGSGRPEQEPHLPGI